MSLTRTVNYKVHVQNAGRAQHMMRFNMQPTADMIAEVLWYAKVDVPLDENEPDNTHNNRRRRDFDHLIQLVKLAEITIPDVGNNANTNVSIAGVLVGSVNISAYEAWAPARTTEEIGGELASTG